MPAKPYNESPASTDRFRSRTAKQNMLGVMTPSFQCKKCRQYKPVMGRKQAVKGTTKYGYLCADCVAA